MTTPELDPWSIPTYPERAVGCDNPWGSPGVSCTAATCPAHGSRDTGGERKARPFITGVGAPRTASNPLMERGLMVTIPPRPAPDVSEARTPVPTSVYRYYDEHDVLIYVGVTSRALARQREHNDDKSWWPLVVRQDVEHFASRPDALTRESELIVAFRPPFNTQQNRDAAEIRAAYLAFRAIAPGESGVGPFPKQIDLVIHQNVDGEVVIFRSREPLPPEWTVGCVPKSHASTANGVRCGRVQRAWRQGPFLMVEISKAQRAPDMARAIAKLKWQNKPVTLSVHGVTVNFRDLGSGSVIN